MRRILSAALCLLLLGAMVLTVSAAGASMSISASSGTVYRGDTLTLTVRLSNDQGVSNGGIILNYDSNVFELVDGSCSVSGAAVAKVDASIGGGVFAMEKDTVVSGTIFTIKLKVKSDATFGKYRISGSPSLRSDSAGTISCGVSAASVTVACSHAYGAAAKVDDNKHESTCSVCGGKKAEDHTWNSGTVITAATCKVAGSKKVTCTGCGAEKVQTVPVSDNHSYGSWSNLNDSGHTRTCKVCGKQNNSSHSWDEGEVIKAATCQETGTRNRSCTGCGAAKTEQIPLADHTYGAWTGLDDTSHSHTCDICGSAETGTHSYSEEWQHDETEHFHSCVDCGHVKDRAAHVPGPEPTETTDQLCSVCSRMLRPNKNHAHVFDETWVSDDQGHWHLCIWCDVRDSAAAHSFEDGCDDTCDVCGTEREAPHDPGESWHADATGHWRNCHDCGEKLEVIAHNPGPAATAAAPQLCTDCRFEMAPVLPHDHVYSGAGSTHSHACACGELYEADAKTCEICLEENRPFPWWIVCIAEAVVFGGVTVLLILSSRKKQRRLQEELEAASWNE